MHRGAFLVPPVFLLISVVVVSATAQTPSASRTQAASPVAPATSAQKPAAIDDPDAVRGAELEKILNEPEPGARRKALEAFLVKYPHAPETADVYTGLVEAATELADSRGVLAYNIKLQELDPADLGQRIKTLNLLLLETDADSKALAARYANDFELAVTAKAHEGQGGDQDQAVNPADYQADIRRLQALAALFEGSAAQALGQYPSAESYLTASLKYAQSEPAAEHLGDVLLAEAKLPEALDAFTLALALPGDTVTDRAALRARAGDLYKRLHPDAAPPSLGDRILAQFDAVAERDAAEQKALSSDPSGLNLHARSAADFTLLNLDGTHWRLGDAFAARQVVVMALWTLHSGLPAELAAVRQQLEIYHDVSFISLNEDPAGGFASGPAASPQSLAARLATYATAHPQVGPAAEVKQDAGLAGYLNLDALPAVLVFDRAGNMVYRREDLADDGIPAGFGEELAAAINTARAGENR